MLDGIKFRLADQIDRMNRSEGLPFDELLEEAEVQQVLGEAGIKYRERVFNPVVTLWMFLSQVLSPDPSCRKAVARLLAWRVARGKRPCSSDTSSYCEARKRLPEQVLAELVRRTGRNLEKQSLGAWLWKGRHVKVVDGTTVRMPDTPKNQQTFPQSSGQKPGLGFPLARVVAIFSLNCGAVLDWAVGPARGKKTGENTLFRTLMGVLNAGDVLLGDRQFDSYQDIARLQERGVDVLFRMNASRRRDFRRGRWLGMLDHLVMWQKPAFATSRFDRATYNRLPAEMEIRELCFRIHEDGFRPSQVVLVTTMLDAAVYTKEELADLYRERWHSELDLNALKTTLAMGELRSKSPSMVRKEVVMHLLAYNLIRQVMLQAAKEHGVFPRHLSFKGAVQMLNSFAPYLAFSSDEEHESLIRAMFNAIAEHRVGNRPGRVEPRKVKRRKAKYGRLTKPRQQSTQRHAA